MTLRVTVREGDSATIQFASRSLLTLQILIILIVLPPSSFFLPFLCSFFLLLLLFPFQCDVNMSSTVLSSISSSCFRSPLILLVVSSVLLLNINVFCATLISAASSTTSTPLSPCGVNEYPRYIGLTTVCIPCPDGSTAPAGSFLCNCPANTMLKLIGIAYQCVACGSSFSYTPPGSKYCYCPANEYSSFADGLVETCAPCHTGSVSAPGSWYCIEPCPAGYYLSQNNTQPGCHQCPANTFLTETNGMAHCQPCPVHSKSSGGIVATCTCDSADGYSQLTNGTGTALSCGCPANHYKHMVNGVLRCDPCPFGSTAPRSSSSCSCDTANGFVQISAGPVCECPANTYQHLSAAGVPLCSPCPVHSISLPGSNSCHCDTTNGFTNMGTNADGTPICGCAANHYKHMLATGVLQCSPCPLHSSSPPSSSACTCDPGFHSSMVNGILICS